MPTHSPGARWPRLSWRRPLAYAWAFFPGTFLGLCCLPLAWLGGGGCRCVGGCLEIHGGLVTWLLQRGLPYLRGASAMTLGHVVIAQDEWCLDRARDHEHIHVRQYECWGPFFIPAYFTASFWAWYLGGNSYWDNRFEREAYGR